jgi:chemotaxis protein methyltransferase CheR
MPDGRADIHVSQFFRNPSTFDLLERQVLPELLRRVQAEGRSTAFVECRLCQREGLIRLPC